MLFPFKSCSTEYQTLFEVQWPDQPSALMAKDFAVSKRNYSRNTAQIYCRNNVRFFSCTRFVLISPLSRSPFYCSQRAPAGKWKRKKRNYSKSSIWVKSVSAAAGTSALAHNLLSKIGRCSSFVYLLFRV